MRDIGSIISTHRKKNNLSQAQLSEILIKNGYKATNKAISSWEKNTTEPSASLLLFLCKQLGITDLYGEYYGTNPDRPLSELNEEGQGKALDYIQLLIESGKYQRNNIIPFTRKLRLFDIPASAGTGSFLDGEHYIELEVGEEVPETADFGIRVSGDSMEPRFVNGQIVWVQKQDTINHGEIGIFFLDGEAFIKKFHEDVNGVYLVSLNSKYAPIPITNNQTLKIFGKVVG